MQSTDFTNWITNVPLWQVAITVCLLAVLRAYFLASKMPKSEVAAEVVEIALVPIVLVYFIIQPLIMKAFYIPSGSMRPTLIDDDHIMVDKLSYRVHSPRHDDVVVFVAPPAALAQSPEEFSTTSGPVYYIKRLIGLPGDTIVTHAGYVLVNGEKHDHSDIRNAFGISPFDNQARDEQHVKIEAHDVTIYDGKHWTIYGPDQVAQAFNLPGASVEFQPGQTIRNGQVLNEPFVAEDPDYDFKLVNGKSVLNGDVTSGQTQINGIDAATPADQALEDGAPEPIPADHVMMMGDNRNDSDDSTHWGPLETKRITGKARWIFVPIPRMRTIR